MSQQLKLYKVEGREALLHPECVAGFRADRKAGLIYGPFQVTGADGARRFAAHAEEASILGRFCPYCGKGETTRLPVSDVPQQ